MNVNQTPIKKTQIEVEGNELQFIFQNAPTAFPALISEALKAEGVLIPRVTVLKELRTIKKTYDRRIIETARRLLKNVKQLEYANGNS